MGDAFVGVESSLIEARMSYRMMPMPTMFESSNVRIFLRRSTTRVSSLKLVDFTVRDLCLLATDDYKVLGASAPVGAK